MTYYAIREGGWGTLQIDRGDVGFSTFLLTNIISKATFLNYMTKDNIGQLTTIKKSNYISTINQEGERETLGFTALIIQT